ncbi:hypothetical protein EDB83DRAFT_2365922, partial [Lactarius deliciosus]
GAKEGGGGHTPKGVDAACNATHGIAYLICFCLYYIYTTQIKEEKKDRGKLCHIYVSKVYFWFRVFGLVIT